MPSQLKSHLGAVKIVNKKLLKFIWKKKIFKKSGFHASLLKVPLSFLFSYYFSSLLIT